MCVTGIGLVGRDHELAELTSFLHGSGRGALAIRGEAGVGKTALTSDLIHQVALGEGWRVLCATGAESEKPFPLGGLNQMVIGLHNELAGLDVHDRPFDRNAASSSPPPAG